MTTEPEREQQSWYDQGSRERCSYDDETKKICVDTLACDQGELYALKKRIKYVVHVPNKETPIYCPSAEAVESCLDRHGIKFSMWQLYRHLKRAPGYVEPKLRGARVRRA